MLDSLGTLEQGKLADVVVIGGNTLNNTADTAKDERAYLGGEPLI